MLKPIDEKQLQQAVDKYKQFYHRGQNGFSEKMMKLVKEMNSIRYKERLLIKRGQQLSYLKTDKTAYCYAEGKLCYAVALPINIYLI